MTNDAAIKGCVVTTGKEAFSGGADLTMLQGLGAEYARLAKERGEEAAMTFFFEESRRLSLLYRRLETCGKPFAAAVHGVCLGGAFELALACHHRVLSDADATRVGLPRSRSASSRRGRHAARGAADADGRRAADAVQGDQIRALMARNMGLVHSVVPRDRIVEAAKEWIRNGGSAVAPWDAKGFKLPSNKVYSAQGMQIWPAANAIYRRETQDNYPAAYAILETVYQGLQPDGPCAEVESRWFAKILRSKERRR